MLVIDDDEAVLDLTRRFLEREGFEIETATSGPDGLDRARSRRPALITLDVMMPEMDGWAVLAELKRDAATAEIPVILMTMLDDRDRGFALGASEFMTKPIDRTQLVRTVSRLCHGQTDGSVLVVEDDTRTADILRRLLAQRGFEVNAVTDGREALTRVASAHPDLILLDLMLPEMDGFEFLEALRSMEGGYSIPVVVMTAKDLSAEERVKLNGYVTTVIEKHASGRDAFFAEIMALVRTAATDEPPSKGASS